jgi:hypothetical protein
MEAGKALQRSHAISVDSVVALIGIWAKNKGSKVLAHN